MDTGNKTSINFVEMNTPALLLRLWYVTGVAALCPEG